MRRSIAREKNQKFGDLCRWSQRKNNGEVFTRMLKEMVDKYEVGNQGQMVIGLVGSTDHFSVLVRRAQSILRWDHRPSLWSHAFVIAEPWDGRAEVNELPILEVPLFPRSDRFYHPEDNGLITTSKLGHYADPNVDANIALLVVQRRTAPEGRAAPKLTQLSDGDVAVLKDRASNPNFDRLRFAFWDWTGVWQSYLWSEGENRNPLRDGIPLPCSSYIEMIYGALGCDLVPGASERNSAPEHLWNAAMWWHLDTDEMAAQDVNPFVMCGAYALRDEGAAIH